MIIACYFVDIYKDYQLSSGARNSLVKGQTVAIFNIGASLKECQPNSFNNQRELYRHN